MHLGREARTDLGASPPPLDAGLPNRCLLELVSWPPNEPGAWMRLAAWRDSSKAATSTGGFVTLADALRPEAADIIRALHEAGVEHVVMLTGDNKPTADRIAAATGIEEVRAELLPADKVKAVEEPVARFGTVAMTGDGVSDAPPWGARDAMVINGSPSAIGTRKRPNGITSAPVPLAMSDLQLDAP